MMKQSIKKSVLVLMLLAAMLLGGCQSQTPTEVVIQPAETESDQVETTQPSASPTLQAAEPTATPLAPTATPQVFPPLVVETLPQSGAEHAVDAPVSISFDQRMDEASVETGFNIDPPVDGSLMWLEDLTVSFVPATNFDRDTRYKVSLAQSVRSQVGVSLNQPYQLNFNTTGFLDVTSVQPAPDSTEIAPDTTVTVMFNRPVVPLTAIENLGALPHPLTFSPAVEGRGTWLNTSIYRFTPDAGFAPATTYTALVTDALADVNGASMPEPYEWQFSTASPNVVATYPNDNALFVAPTTVISVAFNQPMNRDSVEDAFTLVNDNTGQTIDGAFAWSDQGLTQPPDANDDFYYGYYYDDGDGPQAVGAETLAFTPDRALPQGTRFVAVVDDTAQGALGDQALVQSGYDFDFTIVPELAVEYTYPADGDTEASPYDSLEVTFSAPVEPDSFVLGENIFIEPMVAYTQVYTYFWDSNTQFNLSFPTKASTAYSVTLKGDLQGRYGDFLGQDEIVRWATRPYDAMVYLHSPGLVGTVSTFSDTMAYVSVRNVGAVDFSLHTLSMDDYMTLTGDDWSAREDFQPDRDALLRTWQIQTEPELNASLVYGTALAEEGGALAPGLYLLTVAADPASVYPEARDYTDPARQVLVVSDYNLTLKTSSEQTVAWLTDLKTGEPVADAAISIREQYNFLGRAQTDADGVAIIEHDYGDTWMPRFAASDDPFVVANSNWRDGIERWEFGVNTEDWLQPYNAKFYTDRAIYRPGQTVYFKGIIREDNDARYALPGTRQPVMISVYDGQGNEILRDEYDVSENGSVHGRIELGEAAGLGNYYINADYADYTFGVGFQVAAYRKPEFIVETTTDKPAYVHGETIEFSATAGYFFGGPLANAETTYNVLSEDYFFNYTGDDGWYDFTDYDFSRSTDNYFYGFGERIADGSGMTDDEGRFQVEVPADIADRTTSQRFTLEANITDPDSNQLVSGRTETIVHKGQFYIGVRPAEYVGVANRDNQIELITVDWESEPVADQDLTVILYEHNWYSVQVESDTGELYWDSVVDDIPVFTTTTTTDRDGKSIVGVQPETGGIYKIEASGSDDAGNIVQSSTYLWVSGSEYINWRQENNDRIDLVTDKKLYQVGDTATVLIPSPYSGTVTALISYERGEVYDYEVRTLDTNSEQLEIPITVDMVPNIFVSVVLVKAPDAANPIAGFKLGYAQLPIDVTEKEIQITLTPDKPAGESYQPGETVTYDIQATDINGEPVQAEFSLALVDKAILTLADNQSDTLLDAFWRERGLGVATASGLAVSAERVNLAVAPEAKGGGGGGGFDEGFEVVRGNFQDTAYWLADFMTGADGQGSVSIELPDNLTTWVLTARGATADTLVGDKRVEIVSTKPLLVRPVAPRFMVVGDEVELRMVVQNNTASSQTVDTMFETEGATLLEGEANGSELIPAGQSVTVRWRVKAGAGEAATLRFGAKATTAQDAVEISVPIHRNSTPETVGTAGVLDEDGLRLEGVLLPQQFDPTQGGLTVKLDASLAAGMQDGLHYLKHYPYECTEQTVSRFLPNTVTYRAYEALGLDNDELAAELPAQVSTGLQRLYLQQHIDGGWGWWSTTDSDAYLSAYVLLGMLEAEKAGFAVEQNVIDQGMAFLKDSLTQQRDVELSWQANQRAFILYVLAEGDEGDRARSVNLFEQREQLDFFGRAYLALAFGLLEGPDDDRVQTLLSDITSGAIVSATSAHWEEATPDYYSMNTDTRSTAIIVAALSRLDPENPLLDSAVRWLMSVRQNGVWETTQEAAWAIIGLTDFMAATGELDGNYQWQVALNDDALDDGAVSPETVVQMEAELFVAVQDLLADEVNRLVIERAAPATGSSAGRLYYTTHLEYYKPAELVQALDRGVVVARQYTLANEEQMTPISGAQPGDIIQVRVTVIAPNDLHYVVIEDPIPAGTEAIDKSLDTTSVVSQGPELDRTDGYGGWWWFSHTEMRDEKAVLFANYLPAGTYEYTYQIRAYLPGEYRVIPTLAQAMYFPEIFGRGDGTIFTVTQE